MSGNTHFGVELGDQGVDLGHLLLDGGPVIRLVPHGLDLGIGFALLLDPGEIFEIMDAALVGEAQFEQVVGGLSVQVAGKIGGGVGLGVSAELGVQLGEAVRSIWRI